MMSAARRPWRFQFSLRTLMLLVLMIAMFLGWLRRYWDAVGQHNAIARICAVPVARLPNKVYKTGGFKYENSGQQWQRNPEHFQMIAGSAATWLIWPFGHDFFNNVTAVDLRLSQLAEVAHLPILDEILLWTEGEPITLEHIKMLAALPRLRELTISGLGDFDLNDDTLAALSRAVNLHRLVLNGMRTGPRGLECKLHRLSVLANQTELQNFGIWGVDLDDDLLSAIASWPTLKSLEIHSYSPLSSDELQRFLERLCDCPNVQRLDSLLVYHPAACDEAIATIAKLDNLTQLELYGQFTNAKLGELSKISELEQLGFNGDQTSDIDDEGIRILVAACPNLRAFFLNNSRITISGLELLAQLPNIYHIHIGKAFVTTEELSEFKAKHPSIRLLAPTPKLRREQSRPVPQQPSVEANEQGSSA